MVEITGGIWVIGLSGGLGGDGVQAGDRRDRRLGSSPRVGVRGRRRKGARLDGQVGGDGGHCHDHDDFDIHDDII